LAASRSVLRNDATNSDHPSPTSSCSRRKLAITSLMSRSTSADCSAPQTEMRQKLCPGGEPWQPCCLEVLDRASACQKRCLPIALLEAEIGDGRA
jgi:hypothetical protein